MSQGTRAGAGGDAGVVMVVVAAAMVVVVVMVRKMPGRRPGFRSAFQTPVGGQGPSVCAELILVSMPLSPVGAMGQVFC